MDRETEREREIERVIKYVSFKILTKYIDLQHPKSFLNFREN